MLSHLPDGIKAEVLLDFLKDEEVQLQLAGVHNRTAHHDLGEMEQSPNGQIRLSLARKGIYDMLPEYCFHPYDRFNSLHNEVFSEELERQQKEIEDARDFFEPVDLFLMALRQDVFRSQVEFASSNRVLLGLLADNLTKEQKSNRFICESLRFLPYVRYIRGDRTMITWMLRKVFEKEGLVLRLEDGEHLHSDPEPRYDESLGASLEGTFLGNEFYEKNPRYQLVYWPSVCDKDFLALVKEVDQYVDFLKDYFFSIEDDLSIEVTCIDDPVRLSDEQAFQYLNYNTNL